MKKKVNNHPRMINPDSERVFYPLSDGDEYFPNGIFRFNVSKTIEYVDAHIDEFVMIDIDVERYYRMQEPHHLQEEHIEAADLHRVLLMVEIAPDRLEMGVNIDPDDYSSRGYNLIDGHHRIAKAHLKGIKTLKAVLIRMEQHLKFLDKGYEQYVEYWNEKLKER